MGENKQDITNFKESEYLISHNIEAPLLVDEVSSTEYYIGQSKNSSNIYKDNWRIKRIWKVGNVWNFGFPNGNQDFVFQWELRDTYIYSA